LKVNAGGIQLSNGEFWFGTPSRTLQRDRRILGRHKAKMSRQALTAILAETQVTLKTPIQPPRNRRVHKSMAKKKAQKKKPSQG